jgi:hypothetical protein
MDGSVPLRSHNLRWAAFLALARSRRRGKLPASRRWFAAWGRLPRSGEWRVAMQAG